MSDLRATFKVAKTHAATGECQESRGTFRLFLSLRVQLTCV